MKPMILVGVLLVIVGVVGLSMGGLNYTRREKIIDLGPIQATADVEKSVPLPLPVSLALVAGGVVCVVVGMKKS